MNKRLFQVLTMCSALVSATASAETLAEYVTTCKTDLGISTPLPALNCNNGFLFAPSNDSTDLQNDYVGYARITDTVDLAFACRWLANGTPPPGGSGPVVPPFATAASVEMLIHNRATGHTCFFAADNKTQNNSGISTAIVPPDDTANADFYWFQPATIDAIAISSQGDNKARLQCVGCHVAGPYIATDRIAPFLARFGLLNNGHDTRADFTAPNHYHVVGSSAWNNPFESTNPAVFRSWNSIIHGNMSDTDNNGSPNGEACTTGCHSVARLSTVNGLSMNGQGLIPAIRTDIQAVENKDANMVTIQTVMPPGAYSEYRWVNMDTPTNAGDTGDIELLSTLQSKYPGFWCSSPTFLQAHVVGSDVIYDTSGYTDRLHTFNLREGLTCLKSEQTGSRACLDYQTRYKCPSGTWTGWINSTPTNGDDHEERTKSNIATAIINSCATSAPVAIQAKFTIPGTTNVVTIDGPPDKLTQFDKFGLKCDNASQGTGQTCSNYVVRFVCANAPLPALSTLDTPHPDAYAHHTVLTEATSGPGEGINNQYFATSPARTSQQWLIEPVTDFTNTLLWTIPVSDRSRAVRLKNKSTGYYATSNDINKGPNAQNPFFFLLAQAQNLTWTTQIWIKEPLAPPNHFMFRLRNAWVPPTSSSAFPQLYMTLTTAKNGDTGNQDVFVKPPLTNPLDPLELQMWEPRGLGGPLNP